ncbi:MAG: serine hydrolase [Flavobacteriaceae bacterium]
MKYNIRFLLLLLLIQTTTGFAQENDGPAPEATAAEVEFSFRDVPVLEEAFINATPTDRKDGITVGELGVDGGDKDMIVKLARNIGRNLYGIYDSFLIVHKGKLLFESYYTRGRINLPHPQASATKTWTGLALGRAIQLGYLSMDDLDKPLVSFLKDLDATTFIDGAETITLKHALTMSSGIRISSEARERMNQNPTALKGQGHVQALLENSTSITSDLQIFKYGGGAELTMQVIEAVVPGSAMGFIESELLNKMGITNFKWQINDKTGLPEAGWRTSMTSRAMVKLGLLAINKGKWNGEQLIPEAYIASATSKIIPTGANAVYFGGCRDVSNEGYGYFWWNANLHHEGKSYYTSNAQGGGGQFIILIETLDLVIVTTAHNNIYPSTLQMTADAIIPAFID